MGKVARRFAGLVVVVVGVGCSFETGGSSDSNQLGSSVGSSATASAGGETETSTGDDTASGGHVEGSTSFVGGSTSVGNDEECIDTCAPAVPGGWNGPFYVVDANSPIDCPTGFARQDIGFRGLTALPPTCACNCDTTGGSCNVAYRLTASGCLLGLSGSVQDAGCNPYNALGQDVHIFPELAGAPVGCAPNVTMNLAEATWESASTFCAAPARGGDCGADECIAASPEGYSTKLCISGDGDVDCPAGDWDTRTVVHRSFQDQRTCEGCACSGPNACQAEVFAYNTGGCSGTSQATPLNECTDIAVGGSYSIGATVNNGACEASTVAAAGEATPNDAVTLCCGS